MTSPALAASGDGDDEAVAALSTAEELSRSGAALGVRYVHEHLAARLAGHLARRGAPVRGPAVDPAQARIYLGPGALWTSLARGGARASVRGRLQVDPLLIPECAPEARLLGLAPARAGGWIAFAGPGRLARLEWREHRLLGLDEMHLRAARLDRELRGDQETWWALQPDAAAAEDLAARAAILWGGVCLGLAGAAHEWSTEYARHRQVVDKPIIQHQAVALRLAESAVALEAARLTLLDAARSPSPAAAPARAVHAYVADLGYEAIQHAFRVPGGHGYLRQNPPERLLRDLQTVRLLANAALGRREDIS